MAIVLLNALETKSNALVNTSDSAIVDLIVLTNNVKRFPIAAKTPDTIFKFKELCF